MSHYVMFSGLRPLKFPNHVFEQRILDETPVRKSKSQTEVQ